MSMFSRLATALAGFKAVVPVVLILAPIVAPAGEWDDEDEVAYPESPAVLGPAALAGGDNPALGQPAAAAEIAAQDLTILPDGTGLPMGWGNAKQGQSLYADQCLSCHGPAGRGLSAEELAGGAGSLTGDVPELTVGSYWPYATILFDYLRRAMPTGHPLSLSADQTYALSAYLLYLNDIIGLEDIMTHETLSGVIMPNRDGFVSIYRPPDSPQK